MFEALVFVATFAALFAAYLIWGYFNDRRETNYAQFLKDRAARAEAEKIEANRDRPGVN